MWISDTDRGSTNCKGVDTGSDSHWTIDANDFANWGVDFVKDDSCGGTTHGSVWQCVASSPTLATRQHNVDLHVAGRRQYATMRDALNATGRYGRHSFIQHTGT